jgi:hypothetical protein
MTGEELRAVRLGAAFAALTAAGDHEGADLLLAEGRGTVTYGLALILNRVIRGNGKDPAATLPQLVLDLAVLGETP